MAIFAASERRFAEILSSLAYSNPFLPERIELERQALGDDFDDSTPVWSRRDGLEDDRPNVARLNQLVESLADMARDKLRGKAAATEAELGLYEDLCVYRLYYRHWDGVGSLVRASAESASNRRGDAAVWKRFRDDFQRYLEIPERSLPSQLDAAHLFACFYQVGRAFFYIYQFLVGGSLPAARLRAAAWQSIFTHDMRRYRRSLYHRMGNVATLITGPSGTGKELIARAVGGARYIPFDEAAGQFAVDAADAFYPLNLSALSPTLIEADLFGHRRGAFTGALEDRTGWLEACGPLGTVFLDELGELDAAIQVKLLRVLQTRTFQRVGETKERQFRGKLVAATNRNLADEMQAGRFRQDLYYRLCSDMIETPSLREQLDDSYEDLRNLILFLARREAGDEAEELAEQTYAWIDSHLGRDYPWTGNIRELEQCVRNIMIRNEYHPPRPRDDRSASALLAAEMAAGELTADELLRRYCAIVYAQCGSYEGTARKLGLDRRTVKAKLADEATGVLESS